MVSDGLPVCPNCNNKKTIKKGKRKTKYNLKQIYFCKKCKKRFIKNQVKSKKYPLKVIISAINNYNLGYNLNETARSINRKYKVKVSISTIHNWLTEYSYITGFKHIRTNGLNYYEKGDFLTTIPFVHRGLTYNFRYHKPKLRLLSYRFPGLFKYFKYLEEKGCPEQVFENSERCSQLSLDVRIKKSGWKNQACRMTDFVINSVTNNWKRHDAVESFMLINDKATIACEIPIWLWEKKIGVGISGHIDILQIRQGRVYILDYKPDARHENEQKVVSQLYLYCKGLSFRTRIPIEHFRCAWFDEKEYFEFDPSEIKLAY